MLKPTRLFLPLLAAVLAPIAAADTHSATDPRIDTLLTQLGKVRDVAEVALSPDGHQLAWVVETNGKPGIVLADANGQHAHSVGLAAKPGTCSENGLAWAPDSRHLAFLSNCASSRMGMGGNKQPDIYVLDTQSQDKPTHLSSLTGFAHALSWAPDGKTLGLLYVEGATRRASALAAAKPATGEIGVEGIEVQRVATTIGDTGGQLRLRIQLGARQQARGLCCRACAWRQQLVDRTALCTGCAVQRNAHCSGRSAHGKRFAAWIADRAAALVAGRFAHRVYRWPDER
jgi:hypothetical protein